MKMQKNLKPLFENSDAVTEVVGEILMTAIVVLAFSVLSIFAFSYLDITEKPHVDVDGWVNVESDVINLRHSGGEVVDTKDMKIIISLNNSTRKEIVSDGIGSIYNKNTWRLGDVISINTSSKWNEDIKQNDYVESTIVHTKSNIVIENGVLLGEDIAEGYNGEPIDPPEGRESAYYIEYVVDSVGIESGNNRLYFNFSIINGEKVEIIDTNTSIKSNHIKVNGNNINEVESVNVSGDNNGITIQSSGNIFANDYYYVDDKDESDISVTFSFDDGSKKHFYFKGE
ncbi:type IV pilin N-terminal domain-containing protein [Methanohalobium sp.]|uniref:type IV pilin N-terminal domain-containing protein n=1 Tax=Methanohalobium sp. TaxID=2837493 RepID=UPI0025CFE602|nr:type IV pilin N-terminal domain-containing protein [Methanohalobium sp.]